MRCAAVSGASQTMVMREVSARSDSPTVSETMLMLRRRKSEATRVRTPGLSWTRATKVWSIYELSFELRNNEQECAEGALDTSMGRPMEYGESVERAEGPVYTSANAFVACLRPCARHLQHEGSQAG